MRQMPRTGHEGDDSVRPIAARARTWTLAGSRPHTSRVTDDPVVDSGVGTKLRAESDVFVSQLDHLYELEQQKRALSPTDPRFVGLALEVEQAAKALLDDARGQTKLGDEAHVAGVQAPIADIPQNLTASELISGWREAERRLAGLDASSDDARSARVLIEAYRRAYHQLFENRNQS